MEQEKQKEELSPLGNIIGLIAIIGVSFWIWNSLIKEQGSTTTTAVVQEEKDEYADLDSSAYIVSKKYIESILKSPSTADFPFMDFTATHLGDGRYRVTSYVDSENSFGAMIRSDWTVLMIYKKDGSKTAPSSWELEEVIFDGEVLFP